MSGANPLRIRPTSIGTYCPLVGASASETDWGPHHSTTTLTGTAGQNHAPVSLWTPPTPTMARNFIQVTGSLALTQGDASASLVGLEKFSGHLALTEPANDAALQGIYIPGHFPGRVTIGDAAAGGGLAMRDAPLYRVQITESV